MKFKELDQFTIWTAKVWTVVSHNASHYKVKAKDSDTREWPVDYVDREGTLVDAAHPPMAKEAPKRKKRLSMKSQPYQRSI